MRTDVASPRPLLVAHLLGPLDDELVRLLDSLTDQEWDAPTIAPGWCVCDVAAHLLDTSLRKLAVCRDGCTLRVAGHDPARDIAAFVNRLNADGVRFFRALPRRQLIELIGAAARASAAFHSSLDPFAPATFAVTWAGEAASANWFDTARELTERWHHQQQIRLAVHRHGAMQAEFYHPVLDCFMRGLPHWYRAIEADDDTLVEVSVDGEGGGSWYVLRDDGTWRLVTSRTGLRRAQTTIPGEIAWQIFTKGINRAEAEARVVIHGDRVLGAHVLSHTAIVG